MPSVIPCLSLPRAAAALAALTTAAVVHGDHLLTLHVDDDAAAGGDGMSWTTALRDLQDALAAGRQAAQADSTVRRINILIAQGTYKPDGGTGDPSRRFVLDFAGVPDSAVRGTDMWGGYAGVGAPDPALHDPQAFPTILSGDLNGDDQPGFVNYADNSNGVVAALAVNSSSVALFGLTIRGGNAVGSGGGLFVSEGDSYAIDCVIEENRSAEEGGGIFVTGGGTFTIASSIVRGNEAMHGGGMFTDGLPRSRASIRESTLSGNRAIAGGGLYVDGRSGASVWRSRIVGNHATDGAGVFINGRASCYDSVVADNEAVGIGGGFYVHFGGEPTIRSTTIANNAAQNGPAAIFVGSETTAPIEGSIIWDNTARDGTGQIRLWGVSAASTPELVRNILQGGAGGIELTDSDPANAVEILDADPLFMDPDGLDDEPDTWQDNDYSLQAGSPAIDRGSPGRVGFDLAGNPRVADVPGVPNLADPWPIDMGAFEYVPCSCDIDGDESATPIDVALYLDWWFVGDPRAERDADGFQRVDVFDLLAFLDCWFIPASSPNCP